jgi:RNA polymerase sigma factor (sigma-70 family)
MRRTPHVTMGLVSRPRRSPEDGVADLELVRRVAAGDRGAVDDLYQRFRRPAFALARRVIADDTLAEDVLQDVFLSIWRDPSGFDRARGTASSWVLTMVHHKAVDAVRREESHRRRRARAEEELALDAPVQEGDVDDDVSGRLEADRVRTALRALPDAQREALTLAYYGGYTQREVAALTGAPLGTVKTRMLAGMRRLKDTLDASLTGGLPGSLPAEGAR